MASIVFVNTTREIFKIIDSANMLIVFIKLQIKRLNFIDEIKAIQNLEKIKLFNLFQISTHFISDMMHIFAQIMHKSHTCYNEYNNCIYEMSDELRILQSEYLNWEDVDNDNSLKLSNGAINNLIYECQLDFQMLKNEKIVVFEDMKRKLDTFSNNNSPRFVRLLNKNLDSLNSSILMKLYVLEKIMNYFVSNKVEFHINIDKILESIDRMMINNNGVEENDNSRRSGDQNWGMNSLDMNEKQLVTIIELKYQINLLKEEILDKILILETFVVDVEIGNRMTDEEYKSFISKLFCITNIGTNQWCNRDKSVIGHSNNSNPTISYMSLCSEDSGVIEFDDKSSDSVSVLQIFDDDYENSKSMDDLSLNLQSKSMDDVSILAVDEISSDNELSEECMKLRSVECVENLNIYNSIASFQLTERQTVILTKLNELRESKYESILFNNLLKFTYKRLNGNYDCNINYLLCYIESKWNYHFPVSLSNQTLLFKDLVVHLSDDIAQFNNNATSNYDRTFTSPKPLASKHISSTNTNNNADSKEDQYTTASPICSLAASTSTTEPTTSTNLQQIVDNVCNSVDTSDDDDYDDGEDDLNENDNINVDVNDDNNIHKSIIVMTNSEPIYSSFNLNADIQYDCVQKNNFNIDLNEIFKNILSSSSSSESSKPPMNSEVNANSSSSLISIVADSFERDNKNGIGIKSETACKYCAFCNNYKSSETNSNLENVIFVQDLDLVLKLCEKSLEIEFLADEQTRQLFLQNKVKVIGKYKILNDAIEKEYGDEKLNEINDNKNELNEVKDRRSKHNSLRDDTIRDFEDDIKTEFFTDAVAEMTIDQSDTCEKETVDDDNKNNCGNGNNFGSVEYRMSLCILLFERMLHISQYLMKNIVKSLEMQSTPISLKSTTIQLYCGYLFGFKNRFYFASHLIYNLIKVIEINDPVKNTEEWLDLLVNINSQCKAMLKYSIEVDNWIVSRFGEWVKSANINGCSVLNLPDELLMKMDLNNDIRSVLIESTNRLFRVIQNLSTYPCYNELVKMIESCNLTSLAFDNKLWIVSNEADDVKSNSINYQELEKSCCELRKINAICAVNIMDLHDLLTRIDPSLSNSLSVENEINQILKAWRAVDNECHRLLRSTFLVFQIITDCRKKYLKLISLTLLIISIQRTDSLNTDSSIELDNYLNQLQQYKEKIKNWLKDLELCSIVIRRKQITNKRFKYYLEIYQYLKENLNIIDHLSESIIVRISQVNHYKKFLLILFEIFNYLANKKGEFQIFDLDIAGCVLLNKMIDNRCFYDMSYNDTSDVEEKDYGSDSYADKSCNNNVTDRTESQFKEDNDDSLCQMSRCFREYMECNVISATIELEELTQKMEKSLINQSNRRLDNCMHQWFEASINAYMALVGDDNTSKIADGLATLNEDNDIFVCTRVTGDHEVIEDQDFVNRIINNASAGIMERIINIATTAAGNALLYYIDKSPCTSSNLSQISPSVNLKKSLFCPNTMSNKVRLLIRIDVQNRLIDAALVVLVDQIVTDSFINSSSNEISQYLLLDTSRHLLRETITLSAQSISQSALFLAPLMIFNKIAAQILDKSANCFVNFFNVQQKRLHSITNTNLVINNTPIAKSPSCNNSLCDSIASLSTNVLETNINFIEVAQLKQENSAKSVSKNSLNLLESKLLPSSQYTFGINQISRRAFAKFSPSICGKIHRLSSEEDLDIKQDKVALLIAKFNKTNEHSLTIRVCEIMTNTYSTALLEELILQFSSNVKLHQRIPNFVWLQSGQNSDWENIDKLRKCKLKSILKSNVKISRYKFKELYTALKADILTQMHIKETINTINFSIQETEFNNHFDYNRSTSFVNTEHSVYISQPTEMNDLLIDETFGSEFGEMNLDLATSTTDYLTNHSTPYYSTKIYDSFAPTSSISLTPDTKELTLEPDSDESSPSTLDDVDPMDKRLGLFNSQIIVDYHAVSKFNFQTSQDNHIRQKKLDLINEVGQQCINDDDILELETEPMNTSADLQSQVTFTSQITIVPTLDNHNRNINYCHSHQSQIYTTTSIDNPVVYYNKNIPTNHFSEYGQINLEKVDKCVEVKYHKEPVNSNCMLFILFAVMFLMFILTFILIFYGELLNFGRFANLLPKVCSGGLPF